MSQGVLLSHANLVSNVSAVLFMLDRRLPEELERPVADWLSISYLPLGHVFEQASERTSDENNYFFVQVHTLHTYIYQGWAESIFKKQDSEKAKPQKRKNSRNAKARKISKFFLHKFFELRV